MSHWSTRSILYSDMGKLSKEGNSKKTGHPKSPGYVRSIVFDFFFAHNIVASMLQHSFVLCPQGQRVTLACVLAASPLRDEQKRVLSFL